MTTSKKHTKILYLTLRSDWGGAPKHIDLLFNNIGTDFNIYFAAPISEPYGISWHHSVGKERFFELEHRRFSFIKLLQLRSFIKKNDICIIHAHGKGAGLYARFVKLLLFSRVKLILTFHGLHIDQYNPLKKNLYLFYERILSRYTDLFINVSEGEKANCVKNRIFKPSKSVVIYNAIQRVTAHKTKPETRSDLNLPNDKFIILSLLRFSFAKNIEATLDIAQILKYDNRFQFVLVGDGETKQEVKERITQGNINNIILTGFKNNPNDYIIASDVYLSTSRWEGLPFALIEATMLGLPAVVSDVTGNNEVIKNLYNGKLFRLGDIQVAADYIVEICTNKNIAEQYSTNAKVYFEEHFSVERMVNQTKDIYNKFGF